MTKKLYYTCPLEATYMQKNFGIKFIVYPDDEQKEEYGSDKPWSWGQSCSMNESYVEMIEDAVEYLYDASPGRIYVHPDDVDIIKPKQGDLILKAVVGYPKVYEHVCENGHADKLQERLESGELHILEIIKRDNKHFFMPLSEPPKRED